MAHQLDVWAGLMIDLESFIFDWIKSKFEVETPLSCNFFEEGVLDSLSFAELIVVLEEQLQIEIEFTDITDWQKVSSIKGLSDFLMPRAEI
jgi:acyl carrier protein